MGEESFAKWGKELMEAFTKWMRREVLQHELGGVI
jgi:hypothetical protein